MSHKKTHGRYKNDPADFYGHAQDVMAQDLFAHDDMAQEPPLPDGTGKSEQVGSAEEKPSQEDCIVSIVPENLNELCLEHVCPSCAVKEEAEQTRLRALAEMENYKKRLAREHEEQLTYAAEKVLTSVLPSLDNLDLALQYGGQNEACKDILMGVEMTHKLLLDALKNQGLEPVGEVGEVFTPEWHEALTFEQRDDMEENHVSSVMQRGYKLKGRLLRPAKVGISKK